MSDICKIFIWHCCQRERMYPYYHKKLFIIRLLQTGRDHIHRERICMKESYTKGKLLTRDRDIKEEEQSKERN
jgi:hypothetical protein